MIVRYVYNCLIATVMVVFLNNQAAFAVDDYYYSTDNDAIYVPPTYDPQYLPQTPPQEPTDNDVYYYPAPSQQQQIYYQQQLEIQRLQREQRILEQRLREQEINQREKQSYPLYYY